MTTALFTATILCITVTGLAALADYANAGFVRENATAVHIPLRALPHLGTLKLAGAVGLVIGISVSAWLGVAAAVGLVAFFAGAVIVHIRTKAYRNIAFPGVFLLLAILACVYTLGEAVA